MSFWDTKVKISNLSFPRFIGGPVDGVTDSPFRRVVRDFSTEELLYTELRHVGNVVHDKMSLKFEQGERPLNFQVTASTLDFIEEACSKIKNVDMIDLNIACPARNIIKSGAGVALMECPELESILKLFRSLIKLPFTIKMRAGYRDKNALEIAKLAEGCGVDAIALHPRLQKEGFTGELDYELVANIKKSLSIPLLWSGGIVDYATAKDVYERTGVDGLLVSRALYGAPWKLKELKESSMGREFSVDLNTRIKTAIKHVEFVVEYYGEKGFHSFKKHIPFYLKDNYRRKEIQKSLMEAQTADVLKKELLNLLG